MSGKVKKSLTMIGRDELVLKIRVLLDESPAMMRPYWSGENLAQLITP